MGPTTTPQRDASDASHPDWIIARRHRSLILTKSATAVERERTNLAGLLTCSAGVGLVGGVVGWSVGGPVFGIFMAAVSAIPITVFLLSMDAYARIHDFVGRPVEFVFNPPKDAIFRNGKRVGLFSQVQRVEVVACYAEDSVSRTLGVRLPHSLLSPLWSPHAPWFGKWLPIASGDVDALRRLGHTLADFLGCPAVILDPENEEGVYYPVTARPADRRERRIYQGKKGG